MPLAAPSTTPFGKLAHVDTWIFDLDNTLYPAAADLFALIDIKMGEFVAALLGCDIDEAKRVQKDYYLEHGTTLAGLMRNHDVDPKAFLDHVHDIAMDRLSVDPMLVAALDALPGRRLIFTNGDRSYAERVLEARGMTGLFELIHDIHACEYRPKPDPTGYAALCAMYDVDPCRAAFFEDMARNLKPAKTIGMATIWVNNGSEGGTIDHHPDFVDFETHDLSHFLQDLTGNQP